MAYAGPTLPVEQALNDAVDTVTAVWFFDRAAGSWIAWNPTLPESLRAFNELEGGLPYFVVVDRPATWTFPEPVSLPFPDAVPLQAGGNPVAYAWPTLSIEEAFGDILPSIDAVWHFRGGWELWNLQLPEPLRAFNTLEQGQVYWVVANASATWTVDTGPEIPDTPEGTALRAVLDEVVQPSESLHDFIIFQHPDMLEPGDEVRPAFPEGFGGGGLVVESASYFFWIDDAPMAYFAKPNRFALVDTETFAVTASQEFFWPQLNGADLFTDDATYRDPESWAFSRFNVFGPPPTVGPAAAQGYHALRSAQAEEIPPTPANVCALVVNGWSAGQPLQADFAASASVMAMFFADIGYARVDQLSAPANSALDFEDAVQALNTAAACNQVTVYFTGHAWENTLILGGEPYTAAQFVELIVRFAALRFQVILDASRSGSFLEALAQPLGNVTFIVTATGELGWAYGDIDPSDNFLASENLTINDANPEDVGGEFTSSFVLGPPAADAGAGAAQLRAATTPRGGGTASLEEQLGVITVLTVFYIWTLGPAFPDQDVPLAALSVIFGLLGVLFGSVTPDEFRVALGGPTSCDAFGNC